MFDKTGKVAVVAPVIFRQQKFHLKNKTFVQKQNYSINFMFQKFFLFLTK